MPLLYVLFYQLELLALLCEPEGISQCRSSWIIYNHFDIGRQCAEITSPKPVVDASSFPNWDCEVSGRGFQQANRFDKVGLSGAVGADKNIQGTKFQCFGIRPEGEQIF